ncbi:phosphoethanolamine transferase [Seonamhaeicola algicola]|uniref:Phosphoethanolamine transferase n=1 Tax=Seonamhaeicola algicola TaxID=1719036 RepID=A0A5C7AHQ8_9FLAO|nr:phosphoethanolamine transferase [Seonamhaeicola algicola]TXE08098.1 phosphoethanolamine transferase [Seonamhaeicola algicola]
MHSILKTLLVLSIPMLIKYVFLLFSIQFELVSFEDVIEDIAFFAIIFFLVYFPLLKIRFYLKAIIIIFLIYVVLETTSYMAVSSNFTSSYMYLLIESNKAELTEFTNSYINIKIVLFFISVLVSYFILVKNIKPSKKYHLVVPLVSASVIIIVLKVTGFIESNAYHNIVRGTYGYYELRKNIKFNTNISKKDIEVTSDNEVLVVVIGESTTSKNMQIYGYSKETTPLLNSIKDELYIYTSVISSGVITTKVIPKVLTSLTSKLKSTSVNNILEVFSKAEFDTYWLSNQRPIGFFDNRISEIASASKFLKFFNHQNEVKSNSYDGVLIPEFKKVLKKTGKKVIFLHLIGTHFDYEKRYPKSYTKFGNQPNSTKKQEIINQYDNAIAYNDFVVYSFIEELKNIDSKSALLYFSDHGENVYHGLDFFGRSENTITKSMFEIPFLLWTSKDFQFPKDFYFDYDRQFITDNTYDSLGHLMGIKYIDMDFNKSIFCTSYKKEVRLVLDGLDFDDENNFK